MNTTQYIGAFSVPDGYFGNRAIVHLVLDGHKLLHVTSYGYHGFPFLQADIQDINEALWLINNHPIGQKYYQHA